MHLSQDFRLTLVFGIEPQRAGCPVSAFVVNEGSSDWVQSERLPGSMFYRLVGRIPKPMVSGLRIVVKEALTRVQMPDLCPVLHCDHPSIVVGWPTFQEHYWRDCLRGALTR